MPRPPRHTSLAPIACLALVALTLPTSAFAQSTPGIWTGIYAGAQVGGGWSSLRGADIDVSVNPKGAVYGGHIGGNYQSGSFVFGAEGSLVGSNMRWTYADTVGTAEVKVRHLHTMRARLGVAAGSALIYATGGAAFTSIDIRTTSGSVADTGSRNRTGWVAGLGVDYQFTPNWIGRLEWLHHEFRFNSFAGGSSATARADTITVGVSYKF